MAGALSAVLSAALNTVYSATGGPKARRRSGSSGPDPGGGGAVTTLNPSDKHADLTLSGGDLTVTRSSGTDTWAAVRGTTSKSTGKWYFEVRVVDETNQNIVAGVAPSGAALSGPPMPSDGAGNYGQDGNVYRNGVDIGDGVTLVDGDYLGVAVDLDAKTIQFRKNGGALSAAASLAAVAMPVFPFTAISSLMGQHVVNFGATAFQTAAPSGYARWG